MKIANWKMNEKLMEPVKAALVEQESIMLDLVELAKSKCFPGGIVREGKWTEPQDVSFTPKKGKNKDKLMKFKARRWLGRYPGQLSDTIRLVKKEDKAGNLRVYAGNTKVDYARYVEHGTRKMKKKPFLRPAFDEIQKAAMGRLESAVRKELE